MVGPYAGEPGGGGSSCHGRSCRTASGRARRSRSTSSLPEHAAGRAPTGSTVDLVREGIALVLASSGSEPLDRAGFRASRRADRRRRHPVVAAAHRHRQLHGRDAPGPRRRRGPARDRGVRAGRAPRCAPRPRGAGRAPGRAADRHPASLVAHLAHRLEPARAARRRAARRQARRLPLLGLDVPGAALGRARDDRLRPLAAAPPRVGRASHRTHARPQVRGGREDLRRAVRDLELHGQGRDRDARTASRPRRDRAPGRALALLA